MNINMNMRARLLPSPRPGLLAIAVVTCAFLFLSLSVIPSPVHSQPAWSSVITNSPTTGISVSSIVGGVEDPAHMGLNCSCVDRHKARILFIPDLLDSSYAGTVMSQGAQRAAIDFGVQLHITPSKALSVDTMAQWVNLARGNSSTGISFFPSYPGAPDWVISGLPSSSVNVEPLASLLSMYTTAGIPYSSVHSGNIPLMQQLAQGDNGHVWHVGADNVYTGQVAAQQLISQMTDWAAQQTGPNVNVSVTDLLTNVALCFSDMIGLEAGDDRCQGWSSVWSSLNVTVVIGSVNSLTADHHPVLNLINAYVQAGRALPVFAVDEEVMGVVRSAIVWGGPVLTNPQINQLTLTKSNISVPVLPLWIATVDVSPTTAAALATNGVLRVALDQQPFIQGYLSVALSAVAVRSGIFPSQLLYQTGPVVVDRFTTDLIPHAKLEQAGFPECTAAANNATATATAAPSSDVPCFNRSNIKFQSSFHAAAGPAGAWAAPLRAGMYQSSVDMRVRVDDLLQTSINPTVNQASYMALNAQNNLPVSQRSYQGVMMVKRGADQVTLPMLYNLTRHGMPIVSFNNMYGGSLWQDTPNLMDQSVAHSGSDDQTIVKYVVQHLLGMAHCPKLALLDPDGSWSGDDVFGGIQNGLSAAGVNASMVFADSSSPSVSLSAITAAKAAGNKCWFLGTNSVQLAVLDQLNILGNPQHHVGIFDFNAQVLQLLQQGKISWAMSQGMFYQGYIPPMLLTLLWLTGGPERGNRLLKTNSITNEDSYYSWVKFPYVEAGPQFLTPKTRGLANMANCAPAEAAPVPATMMLPAWVNIKDFPFARMAFPVCVEPPPRYYAVITTPDMIQRFQPNYDTNCPNGVSTPSPSWCAQGPANSTNTPSLSYTLDSSSYVPTSLVMVLLNYAQQLIPSSLTSQWRALLNNNDLYVSSAVVSQNSSWPSFDYSANSTSLLILGASSAPLVESVATFKAFGLEAPPGTQVSINFAVTLLDGQRIQTNQLTLIQPACVPGQYAQVKTGSAGRAVPVCTTCQSGYTSYTANAAKCDVITTYLPVSGAAVVQGIIGFVMLLFVIAIVCMAVNHNHPMIRSFSPVYCCISLVGIVSLLCGALLMLDTNASTMVRSATASVYLFNIGFTLAFGSVWTKLFRLFRIFNNPLLHMIVISNTQLFATLAAMVATDVILISVWLGLAPYSLRTDKYQTAVSDKSDIFNGILIGTKGALMLSAAYLTYKTRAIPSRFNETKAITLTIYNTAIISIITCFLWLGLEGAVGSVIVAFIKAVGITLGAVSFVSLLFSPLLRVLYKHARSAHLDHTIVSSAGNSTAGGRKSRKSSGGKSGKDSPRRSSMGGATHSLTGLDSLVREHGAAFNLRKGDMDADLEEGLAGLLAGSDALDAVVKELKRKEEAGTIHALELGIINAHRDMTANRTKVIQHYRKYKKALMTIALINSQYHEAKRAGTLSQYEAPVPAAAAAAATQVPPRRRSGISNAAAAKEKQAFAQAHTHSSFTAGSGSGTGTGAHEQNQVILASSAAPLDADVRINMKPSASGSVAGASSSNSSSSTPLCGARTTSVDVKRASLSSVSNVALIGGSGSPTGAGAGSTGLPRSSSVSSPAHEMTGFEAPPSPQHERARAGTRAGVQVIAEGGPGSGSGSGSDSISPNQIELMPQPAGDASIGTRSTGSGPAAARNFV